MTDKHSSVSTPMVSIRDWLRPALTPVLQNRDDDRLQAELGWPDAALRETGMEELAAEFALERVEESTRPSAMRERPEFAIFARRSELPRHMPGAPGFEAYSVTPAGGDPPTDFRGCRAIEGVRRTSKRSLDRASLPFTDERMREFNVLLTQAAGNRAFCPRPGLETREDLSVCPIDSTCPPANVRFPADRALWRDVALTLPKAVTLIREEGPLHRMPDGPRGPAVSAREMNKLSVEMTHSRRKAGSKKARKAVLRKMKKRPRRIGEHARRHRDPPDESFGRTSPSRARAERVLARMDENPDPLPKAFEQARERVIGERRVKNKDKILGAREPDIDVIARGKAGARTEFGNERFLAENPGGLIVDYMLYGKGASSGPEKMPGERRTATGPLRGSRSGSLVADRRSGAKRAAAEL